MKNYWKDKKVLVTGAAGFIGSHAVDALVSKGAIVTAAISENASNEKINQNLGKNKDIIKIIRVNLLNLEECIIVAKNQDFLLNFAALDGGLQFKMKNPAKLFHTNTQIILNVLEAARIQKLEKLLLMSSIDIYYPTSYVFLKEDKEFSKKMNDTIEGYAWSKRFGELAAKMYFQQYKLPIAIARAGNVYGPGDQIDSEKGRVIPTFISNSIRGVDITLNGNGQQKKSFIYVTDLVNALLLLTENYAIADPVNIAGKNYITIKSLAEIIISYVGKNNNILINSEINNPFKQTKIDLGKMKKTIGYKEKVTLKVGLKKTIQFYKKIVSV